MNNKKVGCYIRNKRKEKGMTQSDLAAKLNLSFQTISKWETGNALPDSSILIELSDVLDDSIDRILNGGFPQKIKLISIIEGFKHMESVKNCFGEFSTFYKGMVACINNRMNMDIERALSDPYHREVMITEVVLQYLMADYEVDLQEMSKYITSDKMRNIIIQYLENKKVD